MKGMVFSSMMLTALATASMSFSSQAEYLDGIEKITVSAPVSDRERVNVCFGQVSRQTRCDYQQAALNRMTIPFWGQITYTKRIYANGESRATFFVANETGDCILQLKNETFMRNTQIVGNGNVLSWDVSEAVLGNGNSCFKNDDKLFIETQITMTIGDFDQGFDLAHVRISNAQNEIPGSNSYQLQETIIKTPIDNADGE